MLAEKELDKPCKPERLRAALPCALSRSTVHPVHNSVSRKPYPHRPTGGLAQSNNSGFQNSHDKFSCFTLEPPVKEQVISSNKLANQD